MNLLIDWVSKLLKNTVNYSQVGFNRRRIKRGECLTKYSDITAVDLRRNQTHLTLQQMLGIRTGYPHSHLV